MVVMVEERYEWKIDAIEERLAKSSRLLQKPSKNYNRNSPIGKIGTLHVEFREQEEATISVHV